MTATHAGGLLRHLRTFVATGNTGGPTGRQLLEQAEDAFQATFLVLAKKAREIQ